MPCDLCNAPVGSGSKRYSASQFRKAVQAGLRPTGYGPMQALWGVSQKEFEADWIQRVRADTTDWTICPSCAPKVDRYLGQASQSSKRSGCRAATVGLIFLVGLPWFILTNRRRMTRSQ